jgi:mono/diheme cytochrome c family protein
VTCHGTTGKGDGVAAAALNPKPANFAIGAFKYDTNGNGATGDMDDIKAIVHDGAAKHGGSPLMAPWPMLSPEQLQAIAEYVKSLHAG